MRAPSGPRPDPARGRFPTACGLPSAPAVAVPRSGTWCDSGFETRFETCSQTEESLP
jgi:hypothetical protein